MILISFEDLQKIHNFSKLQGCGSKIGSATPIWISKFKRAWQAQFLSYNLETLEKWVFFEDIQMILVSFFHISTSFQLRKNAFKSSVHILRRPCLMLFWLLKQIIWSFCLQPRVYFFTLSNLGEDCLFKSIIMCCALRVTNLIPSCPHERSCQSYRFDQMQLAHQLFSVKSHVTECWKL